MRSQSRLAVLLLALTAALCSTAHANLGVTLKKLTWDPRHPDSTPYDGGTDLSAMVTGVVTKAWNDVGPGIKASVIAMVAQPDSIQHGVTLYDIDLQLATTDPQLSIVSGSGTSGVFRIYAPGNTMTFKATHPLTTRDTDARMQLDFDLTVDVAFRLNGAMHPPIEVISAQAQPVKAKLTSLNASAATALVWDQVAKAVLGGQSLLKRIQDGVDGMRVDVARLLTDQLRGPGKVLDVPQGYQFNGGEVATTGMLITAWQLKPTPKVPLIVHAHWDAKYGRLLPNCEALELRLNAPYAPAPWGQLAPLRMDFRPTNSPSSDQLGSTFVCAQTIDAFEGAPGTLQWKETVMDGGSPREPGVARIVRAVPDNWQNPRLAGDPTRGKADFELQVTDRLRDAAVQGDAAQQARIRDPGAPIESSSTGNPQAAARLNPAAQGLASTGRATDELNPQPLPPGPPDPLARARNGAAQTINVQVVEPAAGSQVKAGQLRVRMTDAGLSPDVLRGIATIELTSAAPRATGAPASPMKTMQVSIADLVRGISIPRDAIGWTGPTEVRVRTNSQAQWTSVSFTVLTDAQPTAQPKPNWTVTQPGAAASNTVNNLRVNPAGTAPAPTPASSLGAR